MTDVSTYKVGLIGGDGIGPEVVAEALKVVEASGVVLDTTSYDLGADRYLRTGEVLPDATLEELRGQDAVLLGAVGPPVGSTDVPPGTLERRPAPAPPIRARPLHQHAPLPRGPGGPGTRL